MWDIQQKFSCRGGQRGRRVYQQKVEVGKRDANKFEAKLQRLDQDLAGFLLLSYLTCVTKGRYLKVTPSSYFRLSG